MKIKKGETYICVKNLHSCIGPDHIAFVKGQEYTAVKDNALYGEDNISYVIPYKLEGWFKKTEDEK